MTSQGLLLQASIARATIRAMAMQAENSRRAHLGEAPTYSRADFEALIDDEHIDWNSAIEAVRE
jgi:hypothetical protein